MQTRKLGTSFGTPLPTHRHLCTFPNLFSVLSFHLCKVRWTCFPPPLLASPSTTFLSLPFQFCCCCNWKCDSQKGSDVLSQCMSLFLFRFLILLSVPIFLVPIFCTPCCSPCFLLHQCPCISLYLLLPSVPCGCIFICIWSKEVHQISLHIDTYITSLPFNHQHLLPVLLSLVLSSSSPD